MTWCVWLNVAVILGSWDMLHCLYINIHNADSWLAILAWHCCRSSDCLLCSLLCKYRHSLSKLDILLKFIMPVLEADCCMQLICLTMWTCHRLPTVHGYIPSQYVTS